MRRRAAQAMLAAATIVGGAALAGQAADAKPKPNPKPKIRGKELVIQGTDAADVVALRLSVADPDRLEIDFGDDGSAEFDFKRKKFDRVLVRLLGGDDHFRIDDVNGAFTDTEVTKVDAGEGPDFILGGEGVETFLGGAGDDFVDGGRGNDMALLGAGNDQFQW